MDWKDRAENCEDAGGLYSLCMEMDKEIADLKAKLAAAEKDNALILGRFLDAEILRAGIEKRLADAEKEARYWMQTEEREAKLKEAIGRALVEHKERECCSEADDILINVLKS